MVREPPLDKGEYMSRLKNPPVSMVAVMVLAMFVASVYLYRAMLEVDEVIMTGSPFKIVLYFLAIFLFLGMYFRYLIAAFWLMSRNRNAWGTVVRLSGLYIVLAAVSMLSIYSVFDLNMAVGPLCVSPTLMMVIMALVILYMFLPSVRKIFTPPYAENVGIKDWILLALFVDPFSRNRMSLRGQNGR